MSLKNRCQVYGVDGVRRNLFVSNMTRKDSIANYKRRLKGLVLSRKLGALSDEDTLWIAKQDQSVLRHLITLGIIESPEVPVEEMVAVPTIYEYAKAMIELEQRKTTRQKLVLIRDRLVDFFGKNKRLDEITKGDALRFWKHMINTKTGLGLSERSTARRYLGYAKQIFNSAIEDELISTNPFKQRKLSTEVKTNEEKHHYIDHKTSQRLYDALPEGDYQLRFVLMRYAGLRSPSELNALSWADIDFDTEEMTIRSSKLAHCDNKGIRTMPIPKVVLVELNKAWDRAADGEIHVLPRVSHHTITKTMKRYLSKIGVKPWPSFLNNFRRSAVTDAHMAGIPPHILDKYFGHSEGISKEHYRLATQSAKERFQNIESGLVQAESSRTNFIRRPLKNGGRCH